MPEISTSTSKPPKGMRRLSTSRSIRPAITHPHGRWMAESSRSFATIADGSASTWFHGPACRRAKSLISLVHRCMQTTASRRFLGRRIADSSFMPKSRRRTRPPESCAWIADGRNARAHGAALGCGRDRRFRHGVFTGRNLDRFRSRPRIVFESGYLDHVGGGSRSAPRHAGPLDACPQLSVAAGRRGVAIYGRRPFFAAWIFGATQRRNTLSSAGPGRQRPVRKRPSWATAPCEIRHGAPSVLGSERPQLGGEHP